MIFFGTRGKTIAGQSVTGIQCPNCQNNVFTSFGVMRYFHLYWIPTIPTKKHVGVECTNCKHTMLDDEIPSHMLDDIKAPLFSAGRTLPMFTGLGLIVALFGFVFYMGEQQNTREAAWAGQPAVSDQYVVDYSNIFDDVDDDYRYGIMRVSAVEGDEIAFQISNYVYERSSGAKKAIRNGDTSKADFYSEEPQWFYQSSITDMHADGTIKSIIRD